MKMKIKKDASNKSNTISTSKNKKRYIYDNLMSDKCFPKERNINKNKFPVIGKKWGFSNDKSITLKE